MTNKITGYRIIFLRFGWSLWRLVTATNKTHIPVGQLWRFKDMIRYSSLTQIDTNNVYELTVAWAYHTGDADTVNHSQIQCNPIMVDGILYGVGPDEIVCHRCRDRKGKMGFDANAKTDFDANRFAFHIMINSRGVAYWTDGKDDKRIFFTAGSNTYAIDANTGKPISSLLTVAI